MLARLAAPFVRAFERWMPDAFVFAVLLTAVAALLALVFTPASPAAILTGWFDHLWDLLTFTMQIGLTLLTGHALANTPPVRRLLAAAARRVRGPTTAYLMVGWLSGAASLLSWGLGLVVGAIMAREVGAQARKNGVAVHYPLLVATAYAGFVVWHQGLSSSIGLSVATPGHPLEGQMGLMATSQTLFAPFNVLCALGVMLTTPFIMARLHPQTGVVEAPAQSVEPSDAPPVSGAGLAARLEGARVLNLLVAGCVAFGMWVHFGERGGGLNLNVMNGAFLMAGLALSSGPLAYVHLIRQGSGTLGPILLQYPFYAGIMGIMASTGLGKLLAQAAVGVANATTLPLLGFLSGGLLNVLIPSGGGQWAVQGPVMVEAALRLGADMPHVVMAVAMGDQWTNMIQPFWTLPLLAIAGVHVRHMMGYCVVVLAWSGLWFAAALML